jgi:type II secretory pathway pseudopilin PulG
MPSTIPSNIYTMIALAIVGALLVATVNSYAGTLRNTSEIEQLRNLLSQVAAKGIELLTLTASTNSSAEASVQLPASIGTQQYWMRARNDSSNVWIEGALGKMTDVEAPNKVYLPRIVSAAGHFVSGYGSAILQTHMNGSTPQFDLSSQRG